MNSKFNKEDLKFNLPDYILKKIGDSELVSEIENELKVNSEFKKEYEELKRTFNFLNAAEFENLSESYFANLPVKINRRLETKDSLSFWKKLSMFWKILIPSVPIILIAIFLFNNFSEDNIDQSLRNKIKENKSVESHDTNESNPTNNEDKNKIENKETVNINEKKQDSNDLAKVNKFIKKNNKNYKSIRKNKVDAITEENEDITDLLNPFADNLDDQETDEDEESLFYSTDDDTETLENEFLNLTPEQQKEILDNLNQAQI